VYIFTIDLSALSCIMHQLLYYQQKHELVIVGFFQYTYGSEKSCLTIIKTRSTLLVSCKSRLE